jgi:two-component system response regulator
LRRVLTAAGYSIEELSSAEEALGRIREDPPDLVLLDLNLPRKDGRELLTELKSDQHLKRIPVVVLTTSQAQEDILRAYNLYANCYVCKPMALDDFTRIIKSIEDFWLATVKLPRE